MRTRSAIFAAALAIGAGVSLTTSLASRAETPQSPLNFTADGKLQFPKDYRTWIYLSTGLDMSYSERTGDVSQHVFDNVFVNPAAYAAFQRTGAWPDKTIFVLEVRRGVSRGSINKAGVYQTEVASVEAHVKDTARFKSGWAFFPLDRAGPVQALPQTSGCNVCHEQHAAVDTTFVQFYPSLLPKAQEMKTLSAKYLAEEEASKDQAR